MGYIIVADAMDLASVNLTLFAAALCEITRNDGQHIYEPEHSCGQNWAKFASLVLRYGVRKVFETHRQTHSRTDAHEYTMPPAPAVYGGEGIKQISASSRFNHLEDYLQYSQGYRPQFPTTQMYL